MPVNVMQEDGDLPVLVYVPVMKLSMVEFAIKVLPDLENVPAILDSLELNVLETVLETQSPVGVVLLIQLHFLEHLDYVFVMLVHGEPFVIEFVIVEQMESVIMEILVMVHVLV